ncbi:flagellar hook-length control protein FliK [Pectinatus haikarae]|uniref:Flagellar hook-length control protein FliK n=1 Tax=Pectinatus haikarae TaxID=349096 RepID=A0ABT9Y7H2_9FIRM|nr:flagellar hook-length control protein FliK [Pectinatus haikarae]MDQ0203777.1 flagellar hook-length control protein FliK [Pectinatus haikarae]
MDNNTIMIKTAASSADSSSENKKTTAVKNSSDSFSGALDNAKDTADADAKKDTLNDKVSDTGKKIADKENKPDDALSQKKGAKSEKEKTADDKTTAAAVTTAIDAITNAADINVLAALVTAMQTDTVTDNSISAKMNTALSELTGFVKTTVSDDKTAKTQLNTANNTEKTQLSVLSGSTVVNTIEGKIIEQPKMILNQPLNTENSVKLKDTNTTDEQITVDQTGKTANKISQVQTAQGRSALVAETLALPAKENSSVPSVKVPDQVSTELLRNTKQLDGSTTADQATAVKNKNTVQLNVIDLTSRQESGNSGTTFSEQSTQQENLLTGESKSAAEKQNKSADTNQLNHIFSVASLSDDTMKSSAQGMTSVSDAAQQNRLQDNYDIAGQIIKNAQLIKSNENSQITINLQPEHLGELALKISVAADGAVNASFHSDNAQVRNLIQSTVVQLRQDLQDQGIKVDNINVYSGLSDMLSNGQSNSGQFDREQKKSDYRIGQLIEAAGQMENFSTAASSSEQNQSLTSDGIDYRI